MSWTLWDWTSRGGCEELDDCGEAVSGSEMSKDFLLFRFALHFYSKSLLLLSGSQGVE